MESNQQLLEEIFYEQLLDEINRGNTAAVIRSVKEMAESGADVFEIIKKGLVKAIEMTEERFEHNEIYVVDTLVVAKTIESALAALTPFLPKKNVSTCVGRIMMATLAGDFLDARKAIMSVLLESKGYEVVDLGYDVSIPGIVNAFDKYDPDVLYVSIMQSSLQTKAQDLVEALKGSIVREPTVVFSGVGLTARTANQIGATGYARGIDESIGLIEQFVEQEQQDHVQSFSKVFKRGKLKGFQNSFFGFTGLSMVVVDRRGKPVMNPGSFFDCSKNFECKQRPARVNDPQHKVLELSTLQSVYPKSFAYRCRCGLMEISYPLMTENGMLGSLLVGHFFLKGDEDYYDVPEGIRVFSVDECNDLCIYVNLMGEMIVTLMDYANDYILKQETQVNVVNYMKRQQQLEEALKESELRALQYQVSPHFIFNALNTIARVAAIEGDRYTEQLIVCLARLMRYCLYQVRSLVTVDEVIDIVEAYLGIQDARFGDRITHRIEVEQSILKAKIPSMLVQPLVENAYKHGLEPLMRPGEVVVRGWLQNDWVFIEVADNGVGMADDEYDKISKMITLDSSGKTGGQFSGIGLNNVFQRLQKQFGSQCAWSARKNGENGTVIQISFPYNED